MYDNLVERSLYLKEGSNAEIQIFKTFHDIFINIYVNMLLLYVLC